MKITKSTFTVELTADEVRVVENALHERWKSYKAEYKKCRDDMDDGTDLEAKLDMLAHKMGETKCLRNEFAGLVGVRYMGEDA